jgi:light-regulated signal transduction histidine kinase (bacteriophytochrome)
VWKESINTYIFDYEQLTHFHIDEKELPEGSIVINIPSSFYSQYKTLVWTVTGIFAFLIFSLMAIYANVVRRKKAEEELKRAHDKLEDKVEERTNALSTANLKLQSEIDERKRVEGKLEQAVKELIRSNSDLEQFAYIASHDLKSPLVSISGFAKLLEKDYKDKLDRNAHQYIDFIVNGIDRMSNLVNGLLTYSCIGTSNSKLNPIDVNKIFVRAIANLTVEIEKNGAKVAHDSLPTVIGNDILLEQLLQNLIGNAIKFHNQKPPRVHISVEQKGGNWVFSVKDNGIGIASEYRERIFEMFQRLHRSEYQGTGIGLAACKKIVELHGGNIWVESQPGKGSIFYFTVPLTRE